MVNQNGTNDLRSQPRVAVDLPATISIGTQLTVKGQVKDLSISSAFIRIKNSIYVNVNDEIGIAVQASPTDTAVLFEAMAHISRIVPGEGFAVYFSKLNENSSKAIKKLIQKAASS